MCLQSCISQIQHVFYAWKIVLLVGSDTMPLRAMSSLNQLRLQVDNVLLLKCQNMASKSCCCMACCIASCFTVLYVKHAFAAAKQRRLFQTCMLTFVILRLESGAQRTIKHILHISMLHAKHAYELYCLIGPRPVHNCVAGLGCVCNSASSGVQRRGE